MSEREILKKKQAEHEKRKRARVEQLQKTEYSHIIEDPQYKKDKQVITETIQKKEKTVEILKNDK